MTPLFLKGVCVFTITLKYQKCLIVITGLHIKSAKLRLPREIFLYNSGSWNSGKPIQFLFYLLQNLNAKFVIKLLLRIWFQSDLFSDTILFQIKAALYRH